MQSQGGQGFLPVWITFGPINKYTFKEHEMNLASFGSGKRVELAKFRLRYGRENDRGAVAFC